MAEDLGRRGPSTFLWTPGLNSVVNVPNAWNPGPEAGTKETTASGTMAGGETVPRTTAIEAGTTRGENEISTKMEGAAIEVMIREIDMTIGGIEIVGVTEEEVEATVDLMTEEAAVTTMRMEISVLAKKTTETARRRRRTATMVVKLGTVVPVRRTP